MGRPAVKRCRAKLFGETLLMSDLSTKYKEERVAVDPYKRTTRLIVGLLLHAPCNDDDRQKLRNEFGAAGLIL
jgi:hypothetical protein